jgi:hypothetical protein
MQENQENNVVISSDPVANKNVSVVSDSNDVIGSNSIRKTDTGNTPATDEKETVAIYSTKNVSWPGVGKVLKGYNIVTKGNSKKWLERNHVRIATPEEVAKEFGK